MANTPPQAARLTFLAGSRKGQTVPVPLGRSLRFGRDAVCEIVLSEDNASRVHAELVWEEGRLAIVDLGSKNGVFVNGVRQARAVLAGWDVVVLGSSVFRVEFGEAGAGEYVPATASERRWRRVPVVPESLPTVTDRNQYQKLFACLLEIQRILSEDREDIIETSLAALFTILPASRISLLCLNDAGELEQACTLTPAGPTDAYIGRSFATKVLQANHAILMENTSGLDAQDWGKTLEEQHVCSVLGAPVHDADGRAVAVLLCDNVEEPNALQEPHREISEFASRALEGVFRRQALRDLERKQLAAEQEFLAAQRVQMQVLNKDPRTLAGPVRWELHYEPALAVGGDFFDFHEDAEGVTWILADVCGKGISAALVVSMLKAFCKSLHPDRLSPRAFLAALNDLVTGEMPAGMFLTAVVLRVDRTGLLTCASASHPRGILVRAGPQGPTASLLSSHPGPLGLGTSDTMLASIREQEIRLAPGDRLCFCTDGIVDLGASASLDEAGLLAILERTAEQPLAQALRAVLDAARHARGADHPDDDITLLLAGL